MKKIVVLIIVSLLLTSCSKDNSSKSANTYSKGTSAPTAKKSTNVGQKTEIQIPDTGLSLEIPNKWNAGKYKVYKDTHSVNVDYTGEITKPFFSIAVCGKKGIDMPDYGMKMEVMAVDDWVFLVSYAYEIVYSQKEEIKSSVPSEYNDMANNIRDIISSLKIVDKAKLEKWFNESNANKSSSQQTTSMLIINERSNGQASIFNIGMSLEDVKNTLIKLGIKETNEIEVTSYPEDPHWGNKCIWTDKYSFEFDKNVRLYQISVLDDTPTSLELKRGDSTEQMEKLYGSSYKVSQAENNTFYEYEWGNKIFEVIFKEGKITEWRVSDKEIELAYRKGVITENKHKEISNAETAKTSGKVQPEYQRYADFLGVNDNVSNLIKEDIDLDGEKEIIVIFGVDYGMKIFVLRDHGDRLQKVGQIESSGYGICDFELVKLQGRNQKYLKTGVTNGANLSGFALYEIVKSDIKQIAYSASATGAGDDHLVDPNKDGFYDGYVQNRHSYDVLYFNVSRFFKWSGQDFNLDSTGIVFSDEPGNPEEFVSEFLRLNILDAYEKKCNDISKKLGELNISNKKVSFTNVDKWREAFQYGMGNIKFDVQDNGNTANIVVSLQDEKISFNLTKTNNKWQVIDINGANVISSANTGN